MKNNKPSVLFLSTYPPKQCGIATFTWDLKTAMDRKFNPKFKSKVIAMTNEDSSNLKYSDDVMLKIEDSNIQDYINAAEKINEMDTVKLVNIQHEFDIFGGYYGEYFLKFVEHLEKPMIVTFHTVVPDKIHKNNARTRIVKAISKKAELIIVLNKLAVNILKNDFGIPTSKIVVIPHGIHDTPYKKSIREKVKLGYKHRIILSTFGFIRKSKGLDNIIDALPKVVQKFPNVLYLIVGKFHPSVRSKYGKSYLKFLKKKVKEMKLEKNVGFINRFISLNEILKYLRATDLYLNSTSNEGQIVSGSMSYAIGCGRAVISTPFLHAKEVINPERGIILSDFNNPKLFSNAIIKLLSNPELREKMGRNAYDYSRYMLWSNVAESYMKVFN